MANLIDGQRVAQEARIKIKNDIAHLQQERGITPGLAIIVLRSPFGRMHIAQLKERNCKQLGIKSQIISLPETETEEELAFLIERLNSAKDVHGINIHPLPPHLSHTRISQLVDPVKDVEGLHFLNMGRFLLGSTFLMPFVGRGIINLIESTGVNLEGKRVVIVGRSQLVGKPVSFLLLQKNATVTICHSETKNLTAFTRQADILVVAAGHPNTIKGNMVKEGAIVIDVGVNNVGTHLVGDVDYKEVEKVADWITPVPGGVGPVTIVMLLDNVVRAAEQQ